MLSLDDVQVARSLFRSESDEVEDDLLLLLKPGRAPDLHAYLRRHAPAAQANARDGSAADNLAETGAAGEAPWPGASRAAVEDATTAGDGRDSVGAAEEANGGFSLVERLKVCVRPPVALGAMALNPHAPRAHPHPPPTAFRSANR